MEIKSLEGKNKNNLTMIEVAKAVLDQEEDVMHFNDILNFVAEYMDFSDDEIERNMATFYTDLNIEGSFISVGNNCWGLRAWYPIDSINEAVTMKNDEDDLSPHIAPDGYDALFEEDNEDTASIISNAELDEEDVNYDEDSDSNEEISEYEDEFSELAVVDESEFEDGNLDYEGEDEDE